MITAIPVENNRISNHFSRAVEFVFINEEGKPIKRQPNPILSAEGCKSSAKRMLIEKIVQEKPDRIIVRDLGECMLRKLLVNELKVFKTSASALFENLNENLEPLTEASQGRISHHDQSDGCCGNHKHGSGGNCSH